MGSGVDGAISAVFGTLMRFGRVLRICFSAPDVASADPWRCRHARNRFVLLRTGTQGVPGEDVRPDVVWVEGFFSELEARFVR